MKTNTEKVPEPQPGSVPAASVKAQAIKLGIDVHIDRYVVVRQIDGHTPQPAQTFPPAGFLEWVKPQLVLTTPPLGNWLIAGELMVEVAQKNKLKAEILKSESSGFAVVRLSGRY
jgi:hypothetical protein